MDHRYPTAVVLLLLPALVAAGCGPAAAPKGEGAARMSIEDTRAGSGQPDGATPEKAAAEACAAPAGSDQVPACGPGSPGAPTEAELKERLTPLQYKVIREKGTEMAFSGKYWNFHGDGIYRCVGCGADLFDSETKFDSGTGWPSFWAPAADEAVATHADRSHGMIRTEVTCRRCGAHLGHVFEDGPRPTGLRYCINSAALLFAEEKGVEE